MQIRCWNRTEVLAAFLMLAICAGTSVAGPSAKTAPPKPLPTDTVAAWEKAGAQAGWMGLDKDDYHVFRVGGEGKEGEVPAFGFKMWPSGVVGRLPQPDREFGLYLPFKQVNDAALKELAGLNFLQMLDIDNAKVTDAGLRELNGLKSLRSLNLDRTKVTDAGLKELAKLKSLQWLSLPPQVTDAGLKELAGLKSLRTLILFENSTVTDAGLKELYGLKSLRTLNLFGNKNVTDAGLKELTGLKSLRTLILFGSSR